MKPHVLVYFTHFGYDPDLLFEDQFIPCEICGGRAVDIHHIDARGMGGSSDADRIENLMALCREEHDLYGDKKELKPLLRSIHIKSITLRRLNLLLTVQ